MLCLDMCLDSEIFQYNDGTNFSIQGVTKRLGKNAGADSVGVDK